MFERTVGLDVAEAYAELKTLLLRKGCRVVAEEAPNRLLVEQGSVWGVSPKTAKKEIDCRLSSLDSGTRITVSSSLASGWKNLTIIGSALSVVVASLCWWIAIDLDMFVITHKPSYWSWLAVVDGSLSLQIAQVLSGLTRAFAFFLIITLALEIMVAVYVKHKVNEFAAQSLGSLR